jgi:hypothetical protein
MEDGLMRMVLLINLDIPPGFVTGRQYYNSFMGRNPNDGGGGGRSSAASGNISALMSTMSGLGAGDWSNTGNGFLSNDNVLLGYDGSYLSLNTTLDEYKYIDIPIVYLTGKSSSWGSQIQNSFNAFMNNSFNWVQNHPREVTSIAGIIQASSTIAEKGLSNWNAASNISKSHIFAETISTKLPVSAKFLETASTGLKWGGRVVGAVGLANTLYQYGRGNISGTRAVVDGIAGVAGFIPATAWISVGYFAVMAISETYYNDGKLLF